MVDIEARKKAAEVARRFVAGQISNFEFENEFPSSEDPALWAIEDTFWCFYSDFDEHLLKGKHGVPGGVKKLMIRWVMFLYSKEEYAWPRISTPGIRPVECSFFDRLFNKHKRQDEFLSSGELEYWPFISKESYENAKKKPVLLSGS